MLPTEADDQLKETPNQALKDFGSLAAAALALCWAPAVPEALLATALVRYLASYLDLAKRWRAPIRVPADLGAKGYRDATTSKRGDGTFFVGLDLAPKRHAEIWLSPKDLLGGRLMIGDEPNRQAEWLNTAENALRAGAGVVMLDRSAGQTEQDAFLDLARAYGADIDALAETLTGRMNVVLCRDTDTAMAARALSAALPADTPPSADRLIAALLPPLAWLRQRDGLPLDTQILGLSLSLPVLENLAFFGRIEEAIGPNADLPATNQAAAAELAALSVDLRAILDELPSYEDARPPGPHSPSLSANEATTEARRAAAADFGSLAEPLRAALTAIQGEDGPEERPTLDLGSLGCALRQDAVLHIAGADASPTLLRLFASALADALASLPSRELAPRGRLADAQPLYLILDGFEDYAVAGFNPAELATRGVALTVGSTSLARLQASSEALAEALWAGMDIRVADQAAMSDPRFRESFEDDLSKHGSREQLEDARKLLAKPDTPLLLTFRDRRVSSDQGSAKTAIHILGYAMMDTDPENESLAETRPAQRTGKLFGSRLRSAPPEPLLGRE